MLQFFQYKYFQGQIELIHGSYTLIKLQSLNDYITELNIPFTIHGIYLINFARIIEKGSKEDIYLNNEFAIGNQLKSLGIVFNVGKSVELGPEQRFI